MARFVRAVFAATVTALVVGALGGVQLLRPIERKSDETTITEDIAHRRAGGLRGQRDRARQGRHRSGRQAHAVVPRRARGRGDPPGRRRHPRASRLRAPCVVDYTIEVPRVSTVRGSTSNGAIELEDVGEVDVQTSNGRIELEDVTGASWPRPRTAASRAATSRRRRAGDLVERGHRARARHPQDVEASTSNGAIRHHGARRQLPGVDRDVERPHRRRHPERLRRSVQPRPAHLERLDHRRGGLAGRAGAGEPRSSSSTAASWSTAQSRSACSTTIGGASRMVEPCVSLASTPRAHERLAHLAAGAERRVDVDAGPEPGAAHRDDAVADERLEAGRAGARRASRARSCSSPVASMRRRRGRRRRRAGCRRRSSRARRAAARRARRASPTTAETGTMPPPSALPSRYRSGTTPDEVARERRAGAAEAGLDLVGDDQHVAFACVSSRTRAAGSRRAARRCPPRPGSARPARRRCSRRSPASSASASPYGTVRNPGVYGPKSSRASGSSQKRDDRGRAAVEVAGHHDDVARLRGDALDPVAPGAGDLDAGLDGLGARVHRQHHVLAARASASAVDERAELVVVERAARERDAVELLARGRDEPRVAVPEVHRRVRGEAVEVAPAVDVGHPGAVARRDDDRQRVVVVGGVLVLERRWPRVATVVVAVGRGVIAAAPGCST